MTPDEVRAIVREENMRLLRVLLEVGASHGGGTVASTVALTALDMPDKFTSALVPLERAVIDYRDGR